MKYIWIATSAASLLSSVTPTTAYDLVKTYSGDTFFDAFTYFGGFDNMTSGDVIFADEQTAVSDRLTHINDAGNAIIRVDNTTFVPYNEKRNTIMLTSKDKYQTGTVWVFDALHVPSGCSVWGALWSRGAYANWPEGGEIDIFEGINLSEHNQIALHTTAGCTQPDGVEQTGVTGLTDCDHAQNGNAGCTVRDMSPNSFGEAFEAAGGGVWVTEFADTGIKIWFFSRADVPEILSGDSFDTADLGIPTAYYPSSTCNIDEHFSEQEIIIDLKLCGTWAGVPSILQETCPPLEGDFTCYTTYVIDNKSTYENAYFEIPFVKIYASSPDRVIETGDDTNTETRTGTNRPTNTSGGSDDGSTAVSLRFGTSAFALLATLGFAAVGAVALFA